jgi:D-3-phosphoglycerate dehydrogenase / 2-oxoglutarate reductase
VAATGRDGGDAVTDEEVGRSVVESLILDLLEWIGPNPRPYFEVLDAWRTSCPRLPVWEEAQSRGFVVGYHEAGQGRLVSVTTAGREHVHAERASSPAGVP